MSNAGGVKKNIGKKKISNISPPLKLNKSVSRLLPQASHWSSAGFSAAVQTLFCAHKLGRSSESSCYSRNGLVLFFFSLPTCSFLPPHSGTPAPSTRIDISYLPREEKVPCLLLIRRRRDSAALSFYLLANGCHVCVRSFFISHCSNFPQGGFWLAELFFWATVDAQVFFFFLLFCISAFLHIVCGCWLPMLCWR